MRLEEAERRNFLEHERARQTAMINAEAMARMPARTKFAPLTSPTVMSADCMRINELART